MLGWGAELGVGEELGVDEELGVGVELVVGVGVGLALVLAFLHHRHPPGKWNRKRSHPTSSTGSKSHRRKSPCMALSHSRPRQL